MQECVYAFERYSTLGVHETNGCAQILLLLCHQRFTGINMFPFLPKLMEEMINIGLQELVKEDTYYKIYTNKEIYPNPLDIGAETIHKAIENVPTEYRTPFLSTLGLKISNVLNKWDPHKQGAPNINLLEMILKPSSPSTQPKKVKWLRFSTPTNPQGINPEFLGFIRNKDVRVFLCSLQSEVGAESERTAHLFNLNSRQTFVSVFPVRNSSLFNQNKEFADLKPNEPAFSTSVSFFSSIMNTIVPDAKSPNKINQTGNYLFPASWLASDKFKKRIQDRLEITNRIFFNDVQSLNELQRRAFVKFFDVLLAFDLIHYTQAEYFAFLCNHSADRTGVFVTLMLKILLIAFNKENAPINDKDPKNTYTWNQVQEALIDGIPFVVAKREMNDLHGGLMEALEILKDKDVRKRLIENREEIFGILDFEFPFAKHDDVKEKAPEGYESFKVYTTSDSDDEK